MKNIVKSDLLRLKKINKRVEYISARAEEDKNRKYFGTLLRQLLNEANNIEAKYAAKLLLLDIEESIIFQEIYINGLKYAAIAKKMGYSLSTIQKKACSIVSKLAKFD